ncbi:MAG: MFS transporter, partial [Sphingomonas hengshuiensis]
YFFSFMDRYILSILLEAIKADLQLNDTQLGLLSGFAFALFYATLGIPVAWLADRASRRDIIAVALALWSAMTALCGTATNFAQLLLYRIGVGVGEAGSSPPSHSIIADLYPPEKRAGAMAIYATGVVLGGGFGTIIGGVIASAYGWRWAMAAVGLPGIVLAIIVRLLMVEPRRGLSDPGGVPQHPAPMPSLGAG